ncbi:hypothetical protein [uncultured Enterovirga sp.]|uniref:hypothetical protein n=1 Tax=uncultured Enterovirga sp. TaxID=2026352 RepID=UPI0035C98500
MTEALFHSFLMVDRPAAPVGPRDSSRSAAQQRPAPVSEEQAHEVFVTAIRRALEESAPLVKAGDAPDLVGIAVAAADFALGRSVILQLKPGLAGGQRHAVRSFLERVVRVSATLDETRLESAIGKLAEVLLPDELADARGVLASDNLELRDRFVAQVPVLTSVEVGVRAGSQTKNRYATAARWKKAGDIFSVQHRGTEFFPAFQFREGRPHPSVKEVLTALPARLSPWQRAFWFVSTNGWLGDKAPADMLDDPQALVAAAEREGEEVVG